MKKMRGKAPPLNHSNIPVVGSPPSYPNVTNQMPMYNRNNYGYVDNFSTYGGQQMGQTMQGNFVQDQNFQRNVNPYGQQEYQNMNYNSGNTSAMRPPDVRAQRAINILKIWFREHINSPYPSEEEKMRLSSLSGLDISQIDYWFTLARNRMKQMNPEMMGMR